MGLLDSSVHNSMMVDPRVHTGLPTDPRAASTPLSSLEMANALDSMEAQLQSSQVLIKPLLFVPKLTYPLYKGYMARSVQSSRQENIIILQYCGKVCHKKTMHTQAMCMCPILLEHKLSISVFSINNLG